MNIFDPPVVFDEAKPRSRTHPKELFMICPRKKECQRSQKDADRGWAMAWRGATGVAHGERSPNRDRCA